MKVVDLPSDIVETEIILGLKVTAKIPDQTAAAETSIVIRLPKKISSTSIYFENSVYSASYTVDNGKAVITVDDDILILGQTDASVSVLVIKGYSLYCY